MCQGEQAPGREPVRVRERERVLEPVLALELELELEQALEPVPGTAKVQEPAPELEQRRLSEQCWPLDQV